MRENISNTIYSFAYKMPIYLYQSLNFIYNLFNKIDYNTQQEFHKYHLVGNYRTTFINEIEKYISGSSETYTLLDIGGGSGSYGEKILKQFEKRIEYWTLDIISQRDGNHEIVMDICSPCHETSPKLFDIIVSFNSFEHFQDPFTAAENIERMLKPGGLLLVVTVFACRYHVAPDDYFRYTDSALKYIFEERNKIKTKICGYDVSERRKGKVGSGRSRTLVDHLGGWLERWFVYYIGIKPRKDPK